MLFIKLDDILRQILNTLIAEELNRARLFDPQSVSFVIVGLTI